MRCMQVGLGKPVGAVVKSCRSEPAVFQSSKWRSRCDDPLISEQSLNQPVKDGVQRFTVDLSIYPT
jgi:hypothetical protein